MYGFFWSTTSKCVGGQSRTCLGIHQDRIGGRSQEQGAARFPLDVTVFLPRLPVRNNSRHHIVGGFVEPFRSLLVQVAENLLALRSSSKVDVRGLPAHGMKQTQLLGRGPAAWRARSENSVG